MPEPQNPQGPDGTPIHVKPDQTCVVMDKDGPVLILMPEQEELSAWEVFLLACVCRAYGDTEYYLDTLSWLDDQPEITVPGEEDDDDEDDLPKLH